MKLYIWIKVNHEPNYGPGISPCVIMSMGPWFTAFGLKIVILILVISIVIATESAAGFVMGVLVDQMAVCHLVLIDNVRLNINNFYFCYGLYLFWHGRNLTFSHLYVWIDWKDIAFLYKLAYLAKISHITMNSCENIRVLWIHNVHLACLLKTKYVEAYSIHGLLHTRTHIYIYVCVFFICQ